MFRAKNYCWKKDKGQLLVRSTTANSRFAKAGVSCFYDSEVLYASFVHLMKFSAKNPRLRKAAKRWLQLFHYISKFEQNGI